MKNFSIFLFSMLMLFQACKLREEYNTKLQDENQNAEEVRSKITPQYVVKPRMIFKFYCRPNEKIPDCEDYDVMRVESFLEAAGFSEVELTQYSEYAALKKARDKATKELETLEASYRAAIEKKREVLSIQELEYQRMKKFYASEIKRFEDSNLGTVWMKARNVINDFSKLSKHFSAEVGEVSAGRTHTCALKLSGEIICWGDDDRRVSGWQGKVASGELKLPIRKISTGGYHTCAIGSDGGISCWGSDDGDRSTGWREKIANGEIKIPILQISAGFSHTCAIGSDGGISCWGDDEDKQSSGWKEKVASGELKLPIRQISAGRTHTCAIGSDGGISCLGEISFLGRQEKVASVELKTPIRQISAGGFHTCAIGSDGKISCWGDDEDKQSSGWKENVASGELKFPIRQISSGERHTCAIDAVGEHSCWGKDEQSINSGWQEKVVSGELKLPISQTSAGDYHSCAVDSRRKAVCWGDNEDGQVNGRDKNNYKLGEFTPEDFATDLTQLGYYEE